MIIFISLSIFSSHIEAAIELPFAKVAVSMRRWKSKANSLPGSASLVSLTDLYEFLSDDNSKTHLRYKIDADGEKEEMTVQLVKTGEEPVGLLMWNENFVKSCAAAKLLHIDGTFKVVPRVVTKKAKKRYQLLTILAQLHNCVSTNEIIDLRMRLSLISPFLFIFFSNSSVTFEIRYQ